LRKDSDSRRDFEKLFQETKSKIKEQYAVTNVDEFLVGLFTDESFVKDLKNIEPISIGKYKNFFEEIFDFVLSLFNITKRDSLYTQSFSVATNLLEDFKNTEIEFQNLQDYSNNILENVNQISQNTNVDLTTFQQEVIDNWDQYFPDNSYFNQEEKTQAARLMESGELTLQCKF